MQTALIFDVKRKATRSLVTGLDCCRSLRPGPATILRTHKGLGVFNVKNNEFTETVESDSARVLEQNSFLVRRVINGGLRIEMVECKQNELYLVDFSFQV